MSVETTAFAIPMALGVALPFIPWRWSVSALALFVVIAVLSVVGAGNSDITAPLFWLFFLIMASPLILLGSGIGLLLRRLLSSRNGGPSTGAAGGRDG
ncbi:hypothetical protein [Ovoidimarina sediminis]|uniref:hypothetical protein n=1 Tax=Ovoidimarina sediminis TaxID=3079856 RepID=UPI0029093906|nr:hypothetical protein [Rhodophyticola sp. MJ-SS7]MDU8943095.1 hypothetical protein [Rhodophyticola sp. MJ-SS7]